MHQRAGRSLVGQITKVTYDTPYHDMPDVTLTLVDWAGLPSPSPVPQATQDI